MLTIDVVKKNYFVRHFVKMALRALEKSCKYLGLNHRYHEKKNLIYYFIEKNYKLKIQIIILQYFQGN